MPVVIKLESQKLGEGGGVALWHHDGGVALCHHGGGVALIHGTQSLWPIRHLLKDFGRLDSR